jgi:hypothetical protein
VGTSLARPLVAALAALVLAASASAALPKAGVVAPGQSLGGIRIGMTKAEVESRWGLRYGHCRSCERETWYFTYRPFTPEGAAVVFERRRVVFAYTIWQPEGWRTAGGLVLGAAEAEVARSIGALPRVDCVAYSAYVEPGKRAETVYYVAEGELWSLGLKRPGEYPCL